MFRIIQPNTWYADPHGAPCKILRATHEVIHYIRNGRTCIASMGRFNQDFEPLTKAQAERIAEEIATTEHIEKLRRMRRDRNTQAGMGGKIVAASFRDALEDNEPVDNEMTSEGLTVDIIVADLNNGGPISSALTGNFSVKRNYR